jgi:glyoxylase-like metal-dependent hydrolase (beta-lactamase superfamily II)
MKTGDYEIFSIQTGKFKLDGGAMFGVVPKVIWNKTNPADELNRIEMCTRALLLRKNDRNILIDTGIGFKLSDKLNQIYGVDYSEFTLENSLKELNINNEDITDIILTHLHFDHCGGSTFYDEDKKTQPSFPNAVHYVQRDQYEWAINPSDRDKASFFPENYQPLMEKGLLKLINGKHNFDDVITLLPFNGHTNSMQLIKLSDGDNTILYLADLIPTFGHIPLPFIMGYDLFPLTTLEEKREYLKEITDNNWSVFFEHDPYTECARIGLNDKGYYLKEKFTLKEK